VTSSRRRECGEYGTTVNCCTVRTIVQCESFGEPVLDVPGGQVRTYVVVSYSPGLRRTKLPRTITSRTERTPHTLHYGGGDKTGQNAEESVDDDHSVVMHSCMCACVERMREVDQGKTAGPIRGRSDWAPGLGNGPGGPYKTSCRINQPFRITFLSPQLNLCERSREKAAKRWKHGSNEAVVKSKRKKPDATPTSPT